MTPSRRRSSDEDLRLSEDAAVRLGFVLGALQDVRAQLHASGPIERELARERLRRACEDLQNLLDGATTMELR